MKKQPYSSACSFQSAVRSQQFHIWPQSMNYCSASSNCLPSDSGIISQEGHLRPLDGDLEASWSGSVSGLWSLLLLLNRTPPWCCRIERCESRGAQAFAVAGENREVLALCLRYCTPALLRCPSSPVVVGNRSRIQYIGNPSIGYRKRQANCSGQHVGPNPWFPPLLHATASTNPATMPPLRISRSWVSESVPCFTRHEVWKVLVNTITSLALALNQQPEHAFTSIEDT
jgi:hypothetical protein